ncbi:hypothetical protein CALCODRAFT_500782 [Calocera cornea HHB12733]|uniref:Alpha-ketoglutarate-dependent dioxygenase AlkB-like domain-containing protein n=1 Tax=Calocera cornea HHB12733 TaxID=1353952 RepID=A0A165DXD7_9BASI|nr:hypothetical protein CALCODRAFT_500782 [Calocera cornea HHB12733]
MWTSLRVREWASRITHSAIRNSPRHPGFRRLLSTSTEEDSYDLNDVGPDSRIEILSWPCPSSGQSTSDIDRGKSDFVLVPSFLPAPEQRTLLREALGVLDVVHKVNARVRKRRKQVVWERAAYPLPEFADLHDVFLPDDCYTWEERHFDSVIHHFRESSVANLCNGSSSALWGAIRKHFREEAYEMEKNGSLMHLLHLSTHGYIEGHVDNVEASGKMILGVSLGAARVLRMTGVEEEEGRQFQCLLDSGDAYITKGVMRYKYKHEILERGMFKGQPVQGGQRLSLMLRDKFHPGPTTTTTHDEGSLRPAQPSSPHEP